MIYQIAVPDEDDYHTGQRIISPYWKVIGEWVDDMQEDTAIIPALIGEQLAKSTLWHIGDQLFYITKKVILVVRFRFRQRHSYY